MSKPICKYCKYKKTSGFSTSVCDASKYMNEIGDWVYKSCSYKNKNFKCTDFKPRWIHRRKYK